MTDKANRRERKAIPSKRLSLSRTRNKIGTFLQWMAPAIVGLLLLCSMIEIEVNNDNANECTLEDGCKNPEYNEEEALEHLLYSKAAFCSEQAITSWSCGAMCDRAPTDKVRYIPEGPVAKVQGYVAQIPIEIPDGSTKCIVSFRGSLNFSNWMADLDFRLRDWPLGELKNAEWCKGCRAHKGFSDAYDELRDDVHEAIRELGCTRLVLAGHSLGAAVATIASFDLRSAMGYQVEATWAFGLPRVGNREFVESFEAAAASEGVSPPIWRVVHFHDPVPRLPPTWPFGVAHGGLEVYYTDRASSNYLVCPQDGKRENISKECMGGVPPWQLLNTDHVDYLNETFAFKDFPDECKA
jgi:hypothetical protein